MKCRHCSHEVTLPFCDLGTAPPSNAYLRADQLDAPERHYPLRVKVCSQCWLAQTQDFTGADELFDPDYAYFSSTSTSWLAHAQTYVQQMAQRFALGPHSHVVEVAANDRYLLRHVQALCIACTGIEPTASTAVAARALGLNIVQEFFGTALAQRLVHQGAAADLIVHFDDIAAGHADAAVAGGRAEFVFLRGAVDVDEAAESVVVAGFEAAEPEDAGDDGVASRGIGSDDFAGRSAAFEFHAGGLACADFVGDREAAERGVV
jgi:hypothetical protein